MIKRFFNAAIVYASLALAGGVFYREFTKYGGFTGRTNLAFIHTHYFMLGMFFFLTLALLERVFAFSGQKGSKGWVTVYHVGLNITTACLLLRGLAQATETVLSPALSGSLSGVSGIGHILLGASILALLILVRRSAVQTQA
ncbi:MAG: DUF2871 domain-containing protein [Eubacteriales bacterium]|jgi:hypothetical protein|nr:DUF2871 domain-containing protein [Eubacteriales bacterium]